MKKNIFILLPFLFLIVVIFKAGKNQDLRENSSQKYSNHPWKKFQKNGEKIITLTTTKQDLKVTLRAPAQLINIRDNQKNLLPWEKNLAQNLLQMQKKDTDVFIKRKEDIIIKESEGEKIYYKIEVIFSFKDRPQNSFHALVDPDSGKIVKIWDRTKHDEKHITRPSLIPTGKL